MLIYNFFQVVRHVGRERVPKNVDLFKNSPNSAAGGTLTRNLNPRESTLLPSLLDETNTMEMSIRQVVEVKKMTSTFPRKF
jgi:hypothetical protein